MSRARCLNVDKPRLAANSRLIRLRLRLNELDVTETRSPRFVCALAASFYGLAVRSHLMGTHASHRVHPDTTPTRFFAADSSPFGCVNNFHRLWLISRFASTFPYHLARHSTSRRGWYNKWYNSSTRPEWKRWLEIDAVGLSDYRACKF